MTYYDFLDWGTYYFRSGTGSPSPGQFGSDAQCRFDVDTATINSENRTYVRARPYIKGYYGGFFEPVLFPGASVKTSINNDSRSQSFSEQYYPGQTNAYKYIYGSYHYYTINHDANGAARLYLYGEMSVNGPYSTRTCTTNKALPTIPRMPQITGINSSSVSFNQITITTTTSLPANRFYLYDQNGNLIQDSGYVNYSNSYTFNHYLLEASTTYSYKTRASNSVGIGDFSSISSSTTQGVPTVITNGSFCTDEGSLVIEHNINSSFVRNFALDIGPIVIKYMHGETSSPTVFTFTEAEKDLIYDILSATPTATFTLRSSINVGDKVYNSNTTYHTLNLVNANPEVNINDISYEDVNPITLNLTGSKYKVINKYSNLLVNLSKSTAKKKATISNVFISVGSNQSTIIPNSVGGGSTTINSINGSSIAISVVDSRGLVSTSVTKDFNLLIDYNLPKINYSTVSRTNNGTSTKMNLSFSGVITLFTGLEVSNTISCSFRYRKINDPNYSDYIPIPNFTLDPSGEFSASYITNDSFIFDLTSKYYIELTVGDRLGASGTTMILDTGEVLFSIDKNNKFVGINKIPEYELDVDGNMNISGDYLINGRKLTPNKRLYIVSNNNQEFTLAPKTDFVTFSDVYEDSTNNIEFINGNTFRFTKRCKVKIKGSFWMLRDGGYSLFIAVRNSGIRLDSDIVTSSSPNSPHITGKINTPVSQFEIGDYLQIVLESGGSTSIPYLAGGQFPTSVWLEIEILEEN